MPVYNSERFIAQSIDSVLKQTYKNYELIVIDDLSTDNSRDVIDRYQKKDKRIMPIFKAQNSGSADTRNKGIEKASGNYIAFLDSDDIWDEHFLEKQLVYMKEKGSVFSFCSYRIIDEEGVEVLKPHIVKPEQVDYKTNLLFNRVGLLTAIYNADYFGKLYFDVSLKSIRDDYALWLDILKKIPYGYGNPEILASFRQRRGSITYSKKKLFWPHYRMLKNREKLGIFRSLFYTLHFSYYAWKKYFFRKR
ncbi:MAG: glycosyltransferase [Leptospiraceae bacterium]|nr:glycosyltransferase [Leptospiraceae bacterium]